MAKNRDKENRGMFVNRIITLLKPGIIFVLQRTVMSRFAIRWVTVTNHDFGVR